MTKLRRVYTIAWDGEPSMSGRPHVVRSGVELVFEQARLALTNVASVSRRPNARVVSRLVSEWEDVPPIEPPAHTAGRG